MRSIVISVVFFINTIGPFPQAWADELRLPAPGVRVGLSPEYDPAVLKGIKVHPDNPFRFDFILDKGDSPQEQVKTDADRLIKYFLASLTIPEKDLWVNLSPYENNRIVPESFGRTEMGRDLLAEDYMLKQITASLIYPEDETGKKFWKRVYEEAFKKFGTTNIPVNTFNKVWIIPEKAVVYENAKAGTAYVVESKLKVMLEQDYLSLQKHNTVRNTAGPIGADIIREIVIPELTREVNEDKNFSQLRQVYNSLILASWYKKKIKDSILSRIYADKKKVAGVGYGNSYNVESIYQRYLQAFKKGVYNYIKEEPDPITQQSTSRKYFSGGMDFFGDLAMTVLDRLPAQMSHGDLAVVTTDLTSAVADRAMVNDPFGVSRWQREWASVIAKRRKEELNEGDWYVMDDAIPFLVQRAGELTHTNARVPIITVGMGSGYLENNLRSYLPDTGKFPIITVEPALGFRDRVRLRFRIPGLKIVPKKIEDVTPKDVGGVMSPLVYGSYFLEYTDIPKTLERLKAVTTPDAEMLFITHYKYSPIADKERKFISALGGLIQLMETVESFLDHKIGDYELNKEIDSLVSIISKDQDLYQYAGIFLNNLHAVYGNSGLRDNFRQNIRADLDIQKREYVAYLTQFAPFVDDANIYIPQDVMAPQDESILRSRFNKIFSTPRDIRILFNKQGFKVEDIEMREIKGKPYYFIVKVSKDNAQTAVESVGNKIMQLYKIGDSRRFRKELSDLGIKPDVLINEMKGYTEKYIRDKVAQTVFQEIAPTGAHKRVFQSDSLDFVVGFAYKFGKSMAEKIPDSELPESFNTAYERGGDVVGHIFYVKDVVLKYKDPLGGTRQIVVPYLLVQEKLTVFGAKISQLDQENTPESRELIKDLFRQFIEIHRKMYSRGFANPDIKIAINYGVTRDNRLVLLDTGGITKDETKPNISWFVPAPYWMKAPDYEKELSLDVMNKLWDTDLDNILRSTFVNPDLEAPLAQIVRNAVQKLGDSSGHWLKRMSVKRFWLDLKYDEGTAPGEMPAKFRNRKQIDIASEYGISQSSVSTLMSRAGMKSTGRQAKDEDKAMNAAPDWYKPGEAIQHPFKNGIADIPFLSQGDLNDGSVRSLLEDIKQIESKHGWPVGTIVVTGGAVRRLLVGKKELKRSDLDILIGIKGNEADQKKAGNKILNELNASLGFKGRDFDINKQNVWKWNGIVLDYVGYYKRDASLQFVPLINTYRVETISAMWIDSNGTLYDLFGGVKDLLIDKKFRMVGLKEGWMGLTEPSDVLRAVEFMFEFGLSFDSTTQHIAENMFDPRNVQQGNRQFWNWYRIARDYYVMLKSGKIDPKVINSYRSDIRWTPRAQGDIDIELNKILETRDMGLARKFFYGNLFLPSIKVLTRNIILNAHDYLSAVRAVNYLSQIGFTRIARVAGIDFDELLKQRQDYPGNNESAKAAGDKAMIGSLMGKLRGFMQGLVIVPYSQAGAEKINPGSAPWNEIQGLVTQAMQDPFIQANPKYYNALKAFQRASAYRLENLRHRALASVYAVYGNGKYKNAVVGVSYELIKELSQKSRDNPLYRQLVFSIFIQAGAAVLDHEARPGIYLKFHQLNVWADQLYGQKLQDFIATITETEAVGYKLQLEYLIGANGPTVSDDLYGLVGQNNGGQAINSFLLFTYFLLLSESLEVHDADKNGESQMKAFYLKASIYYLVAETGLLHKVIKDRFDMEMKRRFGEDAMAKIYHGDFLSDPYVLRPLLFLAQPADRAMQSRNGGIDLTPANLDVQTRNAGEAIKFHLDPAQLAQLQNAPGFVPVIIRVEPLVDLRRFLGITQSEITRV